LRVFSPQVGLGLRFLQFSVCKYLRRYGRRIGQPEQVPQPTRPSTPILQKMPTQPENDANR